MKPTFNRCFSIDGRLVGEGADVYLIAEAGVAHFGSLEKAFALVDLAAEAGADAVKFQIFDINAMISADSAPWRVRLGSRCLPYADFEKIQAHCRHRKITFFATAHDEPSLAFLTGLEVPAYKIGSGEVENWPFLRRIAQLGKPVIFSTGMYSPEQISEALSVMASTGNPDIGVLHCITQYPTPPAAVNLPAMAALRQQFDGVVGFSDHTAGFHFPLAAVALGAQVIEKHISLDFNLPDAQDWKVSCGPHDLATFVSQVRELEQGLRPQSQRSAEEMDNRAWAGKSLVAVRAIAQGERFTPGRLTSKRPGTGISPAKIDQVIGRVAVKDIAEDSVIHWEDIREET
ncbi:MAG: N-acetylneuraminate synthase family protein [Magnetococcales bacterium]|nr:N-acetylneuraminate synthase family protein [Magnetococcales bacterium]